MSIQLIECDLRWGVPKDSTTEATIRTCLDELDRCSEETDGEPFFLNMLGERWLLMIYMYFCFIFRVEEIKLVQGAFALSFKLPTC